MINEIIRACVLEDTQKLYWIMCCSFFPNSPTYKYYKTLIPNKYQKCWIFLFYNCQVNNKLLSFQKLLTFVLPENSCPK